MTYKELVRMNEECLSTAVSVSNLLFSVFFVCLFHINLIRHKSMVAALDIVVDSFIGDCK